MYHPNTGLYAQAYYELCLRRAIEYRPLFASAPMLKWSPYPLHRHQLLSKILAPRIGERHLHVSVEFMLKNYHSPVDYHLLALEAPSSSENDGVTRIAYTRDDFKREAGIRTVTSPGKYLKRHFPTAPDHVIRDAVSFAVDDTFEILDNIEDMVDAVMNGPYSCMSTGFDSEDHPYRAYNPDYGWRLAVRKVGGLVKGRALVNISELAVADYPGCEGVFVRTYTGDTSGERAADEALRTWLEQKSFGKTNEWPEGLQLDLTNNLPYLDGGNQSVDQRGGKLVISPSGEHQLDNTDGSLTVRATCDCCGGRFQEGDLAYLSNLDTSVCQHCLDERFVLTYTGSGLYRNYSQEYIPLDAEGGIFEYEGDHYTLEALLGHGLVLRSDGDVDERSNCAEVDGEWYPKDEVVELEDRDLALRKDCVLCFYSNEWFRASEATLTPSGWLANKYNTLQTEAI